MERMANGDKKISTSVSLSVEMDDALSAYCELYSCSRSGVINEALKIYFAIQESKKPLAFVRQYAKTARESLARDK